jgi:hypothetical protein
MGRDKAVTNDLNEEKENNNPCLESKDGTTDITTSIRSLIF